jgi:hypothetical protein
MNDPTTLLNNEPNYLDMLVGPGKKFETPEDLAKGKWHADQTIDTYKKQMDEYREDLSRMREENLAKASIEDLYDRVSSLRNTQNNLPTQKETEKPIDIESLLNNKLKEYETFRTGEQNFNNVKNKLIEKHGENYASVLQEQLRQLDLTVAEADDLARRKPKTLMKMLALEESTQTRWPTFQAPPRNEVTQNSFKPADRKRTWSYYQDLKKQNPKLYYDPKVNNQMLKDRMELGEAFEDGDFHN